MIEIPQALKKILDFDLLSKKGASVLGVDIGSSAIKVVQFKNRGGVAVLETYGEIALGPYGTAEIGQATNLSAEEIVKALTDVMRESNVTTNAAGLSIPFISSLVTTIQMPPVPKKQLAKMIPIEARKYVPVPISEVSLDWFVVPRGEHELLEGEEEEKHGYEVLLVAIHNDVLARFRRIVNLAKLSASFFEIEIFSSIRASLGSSIAPVAVLDMGAASTKLYVVELGVIKASHLIKRGGQDITQAIAKTLGMSTTHAEELKRTNGLAEPASDEKARQAMLLVLDDILSEANRVLLSYQKRYGKNVSKTVLTGGGAILKELLPLAKKHLETEVELSDPFAKVETPAFLSDILKEVGPEFSVAVGLAFRKLQEYS